MKETDITKKNLDIGVKILANHMSVHYNKLEL